MSPLHFYVYMYAMQRKMTEGTARGVMVVLQRLMDLDYADDVTQLAESWLVMVLMVMKTEGVT